MTDFKFEIGVSLVGYGDAACQRGSLSSSDGICRAVVVDSQNLRLAD